MIPRPRLRRRRFRLPDRTRPLALPEDACVVCGQSGAHTANGYKCRYCKPVYQVGRNWAPQTGATR